METFTVAYVVAWTAVAAYVARLAIQHNRLARRLDDLEKSKDDETYTSRAA